MTQLEIARNVTEIVQFVYSALPYMLLIIPALIIICKVTE